MDRRLSDEIDGGPGTVPRSLALILVVAALLPLAWPAVPPLTDLPAHMSRFMIQLDGGRTAQLAQWYRFEWNLLPNLGTDLVAQVLGPILGLAATMKAIVMLIVALQVAGYLALSRAAHGQVMVTALFALPLAYASPLEYGFLNYCLGIALATLALAAWISPALAERARLRWALFVLVGCAVWVCHLAAWAVLCVMVGACELAARLERDERFWPALWEGFVASSCLLVPQVLYLFWPRQPESLPTEGWFRMAPKLYFIVHVLADRWSWFDVACGIVLIGMAVWFWRSFLFCLHSGLALAATVLLALFLVMPAGIVGTYFADMRLVPVILSLALVAARPTRTFTAQGRNRLMAAALAFLALRLVGTGASMALWDDQIARETKVLEALPRGSQLVTFVAVPCLTIEEQARIRDTHVASYALMRRHAFASDQFALQNGQLLSVTNPVAGPFAMASSENKVGALCRGANPLLDGVAQVPGEVPWLWVVWHVPELPLAGWQEAARSGESVLYRRVP